MRTSLWISLALLTITIAAGLWSSEEARYMSLQYVSAAEELRIMTGNADWKRAGETVSAYIDTWQKSVRWLQLLINHEDIDDVTLALERLQAAIDAKEQGSCYEACAELKENARHIYHRDAFTLGNVL